jgi:hypothetical protein
MHPQEARPSPSSAVLAVLCTLLAACGQEPAASSPSGNPELDWIAESAPTRQGYIWNSARQKLQRVHYTVVNGNAFHQGDILLGPVEQVEAFTRAVEAGRGVSAQDVQSMGLSVASWARLWPNNTIPYVISPSLPDQARVTEAIAHWRQLAPQLTFVQRTSESHYVEFITDPEGCWSYLGRVGGAQQIGLASGCSRGNAIHEIGHALGLAHEQSREDRDSYVRIHFENIAPAMVPQFAQDESGQDDQLKYDHGSIMHYPTTAFSINGQATIVPLGGQSIGQRTGLSTRDIETINMLYPRSGRLPLDRYRSFRAVTPSYIHYYMHHSNNLGDIAPVHINSDTLPRQEATFKIVAGLANSSCYSFEASHYPGQYLRHSSLRIRKDPDDGSWQFKLDATFCGKPGLWTGQGLSLESVNYPNHYIRHRNSELWLDAYQNTDIYKQDATWREASHLWLGDDELTPGMYQSFQAVTPNFTNRHIRHSNSVGYTEVVNKTSVEGLRKDATFKVIRGLADMSCYSFESRNYPGHYLRHSGYRIRKDPDDGSWQFKQDATFCKHPGRWGSRGISLESYNYRGYFIRHANGELWIANGTGSGRNSAVNFQEDTTWWVVPAWVAPPWITP